MGALGDAIRVMSAKDVRDAIADFADNYEEKVDSTGAVPRDNSVTTIKLVDKAATIDKRTPLGEFGWITSQLPINLNTTTKTLEFPNTDYIYTTYQNKNIQVGPTVKNTSLSTFNDAGFIYFDTTTNEIKSKDSLPTDHENYIILGYIYWSTNTFKLNVNYTVDGKTPLVDKSVVDTKMSLNALGCIIGSKTPININFTAKQIEIPVSASIYIGKTSYTIVSENVSFSDKLNGFWVCLDTTTFRIKCSLGNITDTDIVLGAIWDNTKTVQFTGTYTVDGRYPDNTFYSKILACLGDSTTWGDNSLGTGGNQISWTSHMSRLCGFSNVINYGVCGSKIAVTSGRSDSFVERYSSMDSNADVILVMGGVNDFLFDVPLGTMNDTVNTTFYGALKALIGGLLDKYSSKKIIFMTCMKTNHATYGQSFTPNALGFKQIDYVNAEKEVCDYYSVKVFDMYAESGISAFNATQATAYMPDKLHYNTDGYKRLAENKIAPFINSQ